MPDAARLAERPDAEIAALRAEIDTLDDALHDLLMRRAGVVARLAASRAKGAGPAIRPGREAAILRRLLARHAGPLPRAALFRLWRELLAATTAMQAPLSAAAWLDEAGVEVLRGHLGLASPILRCADEAEALGAIGRAALAALPPAGRWWRAPLPAGLFVTARLPFLGAGPCVFLLSPTPPDPSGDDRSLVRLPEAAAREAGAAVLAEAEGMALAELPGFRLPDNAALAAAGGALLGCYATPLPA
jgi:chorismate mutase